MTAAAERAERAYAYALAERHIAWHVARDASHASSRATQAQTFEHTTCVAGTESRALQIQLWTATLGPVETGGNPTRQAAAARFLALVRRTYQPRKC